jgi:hypothetical protein
MNKPSPAYKICASSVDKNTGTCNLPSGNYSYAYYLSQEKTPYPIFYTNGTNTLVCDNASFGGRGFARVAPRNCSYTNIPKISYDNKGNPIGFIKCANESEDYTPPDNTPVDILFGADGKYIYANIDSKTPCTINTFGNPVPGVKKSCYCRLSEVPAPSPSPSPEIPAPAPSPFPSPEIPAPAPSPSPSPEIPAPAPSPSPSPEIPAPAPSPSPYPPPSPSPPSPIPSSGEGIGEIPSPREKPREELPIPSIPHPIITPVIIPDEEAEEQKNAKIKKWAIIGSISLVGFILFIIILVIIIRSIKKHKQ